MNCKPGDLAVIVRSISGNEGKIVRCLSLDTRWKGLLRPDGTTKFGAVWRIDRALPSWSGSLSPYALDSSLRPLRDPGDDAKDETLSWLPAPTKEIA